MESMWLEQWAVCAILQQNLQSTYYTRIRFEYASTCIHVLKISFVKILIWNELDLETRRK